MSNEENLIPIRERTAEEVREMTRNGGIKSGQVRKEKKLMRERLKEIMNLQMPNSELTYGEALLQAQLNNALKKESERAIEWIVDNVEGKLKETVDHQGAVHLHFDKKLEKA